MASHVLPQALVAIPSNHSIQCQPMKKQLGFGFQVDVNRRLSLSNSRGNPVAISSNLLSSNFSSMFSFPTRNPFLLRSQAEDAPEAADTVEGVDTVTALVEDDNNSEAEAETKPPTKPRVKMGDIMGLLNKRAVEASEEMRPLPDIRVGDIVQIKLEVPENRRRLSIYKGIVISRQNAGIHTTFRTRRIIAGVGVEIVFPLYSPNIKEIKVVDHRKVRKAKLFYLRDKLPRLSSFK